MNGIKCPITQCIFYEPVIAADGFLYEKDAITTWLKMYNHSPITQQIINKDVYTSAKTRKTKMDINKYLVDYPHKKVKQYQPSLDFIDNIEIITDHIKNKRFNELTFYKNYQLNKILTLFRDLIKSCNDFDIVKYIIDNTVDLEATSENELMKPIHTVCRIQNNLKFVASVVDYMINVKNVDHKCENIYKDTPMHHACESGNLDVVKLLVKKGVDLEHKNCVDCKPIDTACYNNRVKVVRYLIAQNIDLLENMNKTIYIMVTISCFDVFFEFRNTGLLPYIDTVGLKTNPHLSKDERKEIERYINFEILNKAKKDLTEYLSKNNTVSRKYTDFKKVKNIKGPKDLKNLKNLKDVQGFAKGPRCFKFPKNTRYTRYTG